MVARFPAQISKLRPRLPATGRHSTSDLTFQPADALSPFDSALLPRAEARGAHSVALSPLDSALTESAPASPLECALTKTPGVWGSYFPPLPTFRPSDLQTLDVLLSPLCLHILTNCFSRNPFILITIRIARGVYESVWQLGLTLPLYWRERRSAGWPIFWSTTRSKLTCCHRQ